MKKVFTFFLGLLLLLSANGLHAQCDAVSLNLYDSYGDGWNGGIMTVNGTDYTIATGAAASFALCLDLTACTDLIYTAGSWSSENSWDLTDALGVVLASGGNASGTVGNCAGCMDSTATNYDPAADTDDGSCTYPCLDNAVVYTAGSYASENSFTITDCSGAVLAEMTSGTIGYDNCIVLPAVYSVNLVDSWGDGWNGGSLDIDGVTYTIATGSSAVYQVGSCTYGVPGCTDPSALNYNANATVDDGSCTYQMTYVPDDNFEQALINLGYDDVLDDSVLTASIDTVSILDISYNWTSNTTIIDLTGIEDFSTLSELNTSWNYQLTSLDLSNNFALTYLNCSGNSLTSLDLSNNPALTFLDCREGALNFLDLSNNPALTYLNCSENYFNSLDLSGAINLINLDLDMNHSLSNLDVSQNTALVIYHGYGLAVTSLIFDNHPFLTHIEADENYSLSNLDVSGASNLDYLDCRESQITSLDLSQNPYLKTLWLDGITEFTSLDLSNNSLLNALYFGGYMSSSAPPSQLTSLDLRNGNNTNFNQFLVDGHPNLFCIDVDDPVWSTANWTNIDPWTNFSANCATVFGCTDPSALNYNSNATVDDGSCTYQMTYVPDDNFESYLEANGMGDGIALNDYVYTHNINTVTNLTAQTQNIADLRGIEDFTALTDLDCYHNQLTSIDVSNNTALTYLNCSYNQLTSLDVSNNTALDVFGCNDNLITSLDISNNTSITYFNCYNNLLTSLVVRNGNNTHITHFDSYGNIPLYCIDVDDPVWSTSNWTNIDPWASFSSNCATAFGCTDSTALNFNANATVDDGSCTYQMTYVPDDNFETYCESQGWGNNVMDDSVYTNNINIISWLNVNSNNIIDLTGIEDFTALTALECSNNQITNLSVDNNFYLQYLDVSNNQIASLDVSNNTSLSWFKCNDNLLINLDLRNGNNTNTSTFSAQNNLNLNCIAVDDPVWSTANWSSGIDPWTNFSTNCTTAFGCTDPSALNYNSNATVDDGSCTYQMTYVPDDNFENYLEANGMGDGIA